MKWDRAVAKQFARQTLTGIWAAALTPFKADGSFDEPGFRANIHHWIGDLGINGLFIGGKQGEFFSMSVAERKRLFEIAVAECGSAAGTILSCSDQNMDTVIELARHAQSIGSGLIVVHAPVLHFQTAQDQTLLNYYQRIAKEIDIGIALWSHPDSGYLMSPELCAELAQIPNVVAIKYSVPREMYVKLQELAGDQLIISTASEDEWLDNIIDLGWRCYLCSNTPFLIQTKLDRRMHDYTALAIAGRIEEARRVRDSLTPVREAIRRTKPREKPHGHAKYWQDLLGQDGAFVRPPLLDLTQAEKSEVRAAFAGCGLAVNR